MVGQIVLLIAVLATFCGVLFCNILSKFSFLAIVNEMHDARLLPQTDPSRMSVALVMLAIIVCLPAALTLCLSIWRSCYAAQGNNPWPSAASWKYNFLQAVLEVVGLGTFVFCVATRLDAPMVLAIMPGKA